MSTLLNRLYLPKKLRQVWKDKFFIILTILVVLIGIYSIVYWQENYKFCSADMDSAIELNVLYNSISGDINRFFFSSVQQNYFLFDHLNLTFIFYILAFLLNPSRSMYYFMHGVTLAVGALPLYKISEIKLNSKFYAFIISILFLLNPMLVSFLKGCLISIRTYSTIPFLLFTWYFYETKRFRLFTIFIFLSVFTKENIGPLAIMMGLYFLYKEKERKWAFVSIVAGVAVLSIYIITLIMSAIFPTTLNVIFSKVLEMHFRTDLGAFYAVHLIPKRIGYLFNIFSLFVFVPLSGVEILAIATPKFIENLMYSYSYSTTGMDIWIKNNAILVPFLFISMAYGLSRIQKVSKRRMSPKTSKLVVLLILIVMLSNFTLFFIRGEDVKDNGFYRRRGIDWRCEISPDTYNERWNGLMVLGKEIPKSGGLLVDRSLSLPFIDRKELYIWSLWSMDLSNYMNANISYALINQDLINCLKEKDPSAAINVSSMSMLGSWEKIGENNGFVLFKKL